MQNEPNHWSDSVDSFHRQILFSNQFCARKYSVQKRYSPNSWWGNFFLQITCLILTAAILGFGVVFVTASHMRFHDSASMYLGICLAFVLVFAACLSFRLTNFASWYGSLEWRNVDLPEGPRDAKLEEAIALVRRNISDRRKIRLIEFRHVDFSLKGLCCWVPEERQPIREKRILFRALEFSFAVEKCWLEVDPPDPS